MSYRDLYPRTLRRTSAVAPIEYRDASQSVAPYLEGRAVPYKAWTNVGPYHEQIWPSCFVEALQDGPALPLLLFHDSRSFPVGKAEKWIHKPDGLYARWRLDDSDRAREAARQASIGHLSLSVGFNPVRDGSEFRIDEQGETWVTRLAARLLEVSLTPTPAYADAKVLLAKL